MKDPAWDNPAIVFAVVAVSGIVGMCLAAWLCRC